MITSTYGVGSGPFAPLAGACFGTPRSSTWGFGGDCFAAGLRHSGDVESAHASNHSKKKKNCKRTQSVYRPWALPALAGCAECY